MAVDRKKNTVGEEKDPLKKEKSEEQEMLSQQIHQEESCCRCHDSKVRTEKEYRDLIHRLNRIEGQVRGIRGMVEKNAYCPDILIQVAAVNAALNSFNKVLLASHIRTCVTEDIRDGRDDTVEELVGVLQKLMK